MTWEAILALARSGDCAREHRAIVQAWTLLRYEGYPPPEKWSAEKREALALLDGLHQKYTKDAEGFVRDLSRFEDAVLIKSGMAVP